MRTSRAGKVGLAWRLLCPPADKSGAPEEIRTPDPQIRSLMLYPAELRVRSRAVNLLRGAAKGKRNQEGPPSLPPAPPKPSKSFPLRRKSPQEASSRTLVCVAHAG